MSLTWMPREHGIKDHDRHSKEHWGTEAPCVVYEKKPLKDLKGNVVPGLFNAWIRLNNPAQYNSYTTEMVKGVIAASRMPPQTARWWPPYSPAPVRLRSAPAGTPRNTPSTTACGRGIRRLHGALQQHGRRHPHVQEARHLPGQRHARSGRTGNRNGLRHHGLSTSRFSAKRAPGTARLRWAGPRTSCPGS